MRVAIVYAGNISRESGTSERVLSIAKELANLGIYVTLSGIRVSSSNIENLRNLYVIYMPNNVYKLYSVIKWICQLIACALANRYDIVQVESFSLPRTLLLYFMLRPFCKKFIVVFHDKYFKHDPRKSIIGRIQIFLQRIIFIIFDAVITPGYSVKNFFKELHGDILARKIIVIPNGTPEEDFTPASASLHLRRYYGIDEDAFVALYFGAMTFKPNYVAALLLYKISDYVAKNFEKNNGKKLIFIVAGKVSELLPKAKHYIPLGFVENLAELFSITDAVVLPHAPSYSGPHVKTLYAFRSGKPVIATEDAVKDIPFAIPGNTFLIFDIKKPDTLIDALSRIYCNYELRRKLVFNACKYSRILTWKLIALLHLKLYSILLHVESKA